MSPPIHAQSKGRRVHALPVDAPLMQGWPHRAGAPATRASGPGAFRDPSVGRRTRDRDGRVAAVRAELLLA